MRLIAAIILSLGLAACSPSPHNGTAGAQTDKSSVASNEPTATAPQSSSVAAASGPFGIAMGEDIGRLNAKPIAAKPTYFEISSPPLPQPDFAAVIVQAAPGVGICWIKGLGNPFQSDDFGMAARSHADTLEGALESKYGKPEPNDTLVPGSIWNEPRDWAMGLRKGDRQYTYHWRRPPNPPPQWAQFTEIYVAVAPSGGSDFRIDLEYYSPKGPDCDAAAKKAAASGL